MAEPPGGLQQGSHQCHELGRSQPRSQQSGLGETLRPAGGGTVKGKGGQLLPPRHSLGSGCGGGAAGVPLSGSLVPDPWQVHGEGLEDSPPLGGAGEEEEEEAELEEGQGGGGWSPLGLRGLTHGGGSPKGSGEGASRGTGPLGQRLRTRGTDPTSSQSPSAPGPLKTAKPGGSGRRPAGLRGRGTQPPGSRAAGGGGGSGGPPRFGRGLCGVPGCGVQGLESGEGPGAGCEGESRPESSTFSGEEEEKGEEEEVRT